MIPGARYVHTNLVARDWPLLASFYVETFGCVILSPERDYSGSDLSAGTGIPNARLRGAHLRLPGYGDSGGPTLEIFQYDPEGTAEAAPPANRPGFGHIAFTVPSVPDARREVLARGGSTHGEIVTLELSTGAKVTWCYVRDPEGNLVEL
ncbi:MAG TPA: VOC family protein, partial [Candidatus Eisenbacteria bacterium]|nr:VOC family protein [Candidatus Eisenbacteria bacterium]